MAKSEEDTMSKAAALLNRLNELLNCLIEFVPKTDRSIISVKEI